MSDERFDADGNPFVCSGGTTETVAASSFDLRSHALPGWYAAPDDSPYPWYWDGKRWADPNDRLHAMLLRLTELNLNGIAERVHRARAPKIQRKLYWHLFKNYVTQKVT